MTDRTQPEALRLAFDLEQRWNDNMTCAELDAAAELRRQHVLLDEQQLTIAALNSCIGCETTTENLTAVGRLEARIADLEAQLDAVGAGGVSLYGGDSYGDGNVYRGTRSADSAVRTYTVHDLAHAKGVPRLVTNAMLAMSEKLAEALDKLHVLEEVANRLSIDLECMTLDPTNAHWHDTANESLQRYRDLMDAWYPQDHVSPLGKD